eukprot:GHVL01021824.1.p1 GENE.GHVL01021824.1~~GHVL01021824.1.p1  ORF type:complete len:587 (+),score=72.33 GHVL01021824.1:1041-2801(+)
MICTANYIARKYGIRAGMPGFIAKRLCPDIVFVKPNFEKYKGVSEKARAIMSEYDPSLECVSLDEAYLRVDPWLRARNKLTSTDKKELGCEIRRRMFEVTGGLTSSAGISSSRVVAKICSDVEKPNGQTLIEESDIENFMKKLPVRKIPGIGKCREKELIALGIETAGLIPENYWLISQIFSPATADFLLRAAFGIDQSPREDQARKSYSCDKTFSGTDDINLLKEKIQESAVTLAEQLSMKSILTQHVTLKIKSAEFTIRTIGESLITATNQADKIYMVGERLMFKYVNELAPHASRHISSFPTKVRLIGLRCSSLVFRAEITAVSKTNERGEKSSRISEWLCSKSDVKKQEDIFIKIPQGNEIDLQKPLINRMLNTESPYKRKIHHSSEHAIDECQESKCESVNNSHLTKREILFDRESCDKLSNQSTIIDNNKSSDLKSYLPAEILSIKTTSCASIDEQKTLHLHKDKSNPVSKPTSEIGNKRQRNSDEKMSQHDSLICPVCNKSGFANERALSFHFDNSHPISNQTNENAKKRAKKDKHTPREVSNLKLESFLIRWSKSTTSALPTSPCRKKVSSDVINVSP